jgi:hypothetical protein
VFVPDHLQWPQQAGAQQGLHPIHHIQRTGTCHLFGGVEGEAADEHPETGEQCLLRGGEQVVAPLQRRPQRPMPFHTAGRWGAQQVEPTAETIKDSAGREKG